MDSRWFGLASAYTYERSKFLVIFYLVSFGDSDLNLQNSWLWFCFCCFLLEIRMKLWIFSFLLAGSEPSNVPSSSQSLASVIVLEFAIINGEFALELQRKWFNDEDSMLNLWESSQTPLNFAGFWFWKRLGFECSWIFFWICDFDLTDKREKFLFLFMVMWLELNGAEPWTSDTVCLI